MSKTFPIIKAGYIFNPFLEKIKNDISLKYTKIQIKYPCRLDAMAINPAAVSYNSSMVFTPGEVVISVQKYIKVRINVLKETGNEIIISDSTKRKVLVKHAYKLMCKALNRYPTLEISVDSTNIPKHCGFGSSSSTITAVSVAINELYGNPISKKELIKYLASNHAEEISDENEEELKVVQCIGGGATNGQYSEGIFIISGRSCLISKMKYKGNIIIGIPNDFVEQDANVLMSLEEKNLWKFEKTGNDYKDKIAYVFLHQVLPEMTEGKIDSLANIVYDYRFNMGSIDNCSFVFERMNSIAENLRDVFENNHCDFLALSSVGPAFFVITSNEKDEAYCVRKFKQQNLKIIKTKICNNKYILENKIENFWKKDETNLLFYNKNTSKYITDCLDEIIVNKNIFNCIDIGCGGGRYSKYVSAKNVVVTAIDKNKEMYQYINLENNKNITFKNENMDELNEDDKSYDMALSIGVIHNSESISQFKKSFKEIYRVLKQNGYAVVSLFTNDILTKDLSKGSKKGEYFVKDRPPMILLSKDEITKILLDLDFKIVKKLDEHVTDVGNGGKRNVWSILLQK